MRNPPRRRVGIAGAVVAVALAAGGVTAFAQGDDPPALNLAFAANGTLTVSGAENVKGAAATLVASNATGKDRSIAVVRLEPGKTLQDFEQAAQNAKGFSDLDGIAVVDAFVDAPPNGGSTSQTKIVAGATYVVLDFTGEQPKPAGTFVAGAAAPAARLPAADRSASLRNYRFSIKSTLPRKGTLRITNKGDEYHEMIGFRLTKGTDPKTILRQLKQGKEPKKGIGGAPVGLQLPVGPGAVNQSSYKVKRGTYVFACFLPNAKGKPHATLGMEKVVRFK